MTGVSIKNHKGGYRELPASKSISNRVLVIRELCERKFNIENLSDAADTVLMQNLLAKINSEKGKNTYTVLYTDNAGTVLRFLTALCSCLPGIWVLTGNERMKHRPIKPLVDALINLNVNIKYLNVKNFPPIEIKGKKIDKNKTFVDASKSSQYLSALMLIAPCLKNGLQINISENISSLPYINMTASIMNYFGIDVICENNKINILKGNYTPKDFFVENDWTAASYSFLEVALTGENVYLSGLLKNSIQGDKIVCDIFKKLGVASNFRNNILEIKKISDPVQLFYQDFKDCPDLFINVAVACAALGVNARLTGLENLIYKESNRLDIFEENIVKLGYEIIRKGNYEVIITGNRHNIDNIPVIHTAGDHRMAMAFAYLANIVGKIIIDDCKVVDKSYPVFWNNLKNAGFIIE